MAKIQWSSTYETGDPEVDGQHQTLFRMLNEVHDAILRNETRDVISKTLAGLARYTAEHFSSEERLMRDSNYPNLAEHVKMHQMLVEKVASLTADYKSGRLVLAASLLQFLSDWLRNHIQAEDARMICWIRKAGQ